jgi:hypothetical protein
MNDTWDGFVKKAAAWITANPGHADIEVLQQATTSADRLRHTKIKKIRHLICAVLDCSKPWEVVVGQAIGTLRKEDLANSNMLIDFLGAEMVRNVIFRDAA